MAETIKKENFFETIKKGDFVELNYTGKLKENNTIFDTTKADVAKAEGIPTQKQFKPIIACVGENHLLKGIDRQLEGKEVGKNYTIDVSAEEGFGKKNPKLLQLIPRKIFKEQNIQPMVGLEINVDNQVGTIRSASGGRVIVDFNHPLSSKDLIYDIEILRLVTAENEKVEAVLSAIGMPFDKVEVKEGKVEVTTQAQMPPQFTEIFAKDIVRTTGVKDMTFKANSETENSKPAIKQTAENSKPAVAQPEEK